MKISNGIAMLEIPSSSMGQSEMIYPTLIWDKDSVILVDTGYLNDLPKFRLAIENLGLSFDSINKIVLTHHDVDHTGSLANIIDTSKQKIEVACHEKEKPYIEGKNPPLKLTLLEDKLPVLPDAMKMYYETLKKNYNKAKVHVDIVLKDGEELPYCGGITVITTPGHTPGHICLYHKNSKTLIAGDTLGIDKGELIKPPAFANIDPVAAENSLKKLLNYHIDNVICYHGGLYNKGNVTKRLSQLIIE